MQTCATKYPATLVRYSINNLASINYYITDARVKSHMCNSVLYEIHDLKIITPQTI